MVTQTNFVILCHYRQDTDRMTIMIASHCINFRFRPLASTCTPSLKLFERAEDEGRRGDDDDEEREEGGDLRGTLIKNS